MITVYVKLLEEGTEVWRPAQAEPLGKMTARLLPAPNYEHQGERWEFPPGSTVKYERRMLSDERVFVAVT
jgi:hypothetical protein